MLRRNLIFFPHGISETTTVQLLLGDACMLVEVDNNHPGELEVGVVAVGLVKHSTVVRSAFKTL